MAGAPDPGYGDLFTGLKMFQDSIKQLATTRALTSANEATQQIRDSELNDFQKNQQLRNVGQGLAYQLASNGVNGETIATLAGFAPPRPPSQFNTPFEALSSTQASPEQKQAAVDYQKREIDLYGQKLGLQQAAIGARQKDVNADKADLKPDAVDPQAKEDNANYNKWQGQFSTISNSIRMAPGKSQDLLNRISRTETALNSYKPGQAVPSSVATEIGTGIASAIKGGQLNQEEVDRWIPKTVATDATQASAYVQDHPALLQIPEFTKIWKDQVNREFENITNSREDSLLKAANGNASLIDSSKANDYKTAIAAELGVKPSDVMRDPDTGKITTTQKLQADNKTDNITALFKQAKVAVKKTNGDPDEKIKAQNFFNQTGLNPDDPIDAVQRQVNFNVRTGRYDSLFGRGK